MYKSYIDLLCSLVTVNFSGVTYKYKLNRHPGGKRD